MVGSRRRIVAGAFEHLGLAQPELAEQLADAYSWEREARMEPLPGALDALDAFRARGIRLGLVTNGSSAFQRGKVERFGLGGYFEAVVVEGEMGYGKPDPRSFVAALAQLGADASATWMVGDNLSADVAGAQAAGLRAVWVDIHERGLPEGSGVAPDRVVRAIAELV